MTRDQRLVLTFSAACLFAAAVLLQHVSAGPPAVETVERSVRTSSPGHLRMQFLGDTMLGDAASSVIRRRGVDWPLAGALPDARADFVVVNAEAPFTARSYVANPAKQYSYASVPDGAAALARSGVDAVGLANNHAMDAGPRGLRDTLRAARAAGISTFGAGADLGAAERPLLVRSEIGVVAVVGFGEDFGSDVTAAETRAGTLTLSARSVQRGADLARAAGADWVVAFVHWGDNYADVDASQRYWGRMLVEAGFDLVVGTGPHVAQPIRVIRGVPVVYSLGNYVFGSPGRFSAFGKPGIGLAVTADFSARGVVALDVQCLVTDNEVVRFQPRPCTRGEARRALPVVHEGLVARGATARLDLGRAVMAP